MISRLTSRPSMQVVATTVVTALSLGLIVGVVVLTSTSLGCGPAAKLGLKGVNHHCTTVASVIPLASPLPTQSPRPYSPPPVVPITPTPSAPFIPPVSAPAPPYTGPVSSAYPPFAPGVSNQNGPIVATYPLTCRLPVFAGPPGSGGFIQFPGGNFVADPSSVVALPSPGLPPQLGYNNPGGGMTYDRALSRWLPVAPSWVSPDGSKYAYAGVDGVYVVDVATNSQTEQGSGQRWTIAGVGAQGVYASVVSQGGLWLMPFSGAPHQITTAGFWQAVGAGAAWGTATSAVPQGIANTIIRLDLTSGTISDWFTRPTASSSVLGVDGDGKPLVYVQYFDYNGASEVWAAKGITSFPIFGSVGGMYQEGPPIADAHGIWFPMGSQPNGAGVALYIPGSGLYWMTSYGVQLAGGCS